MPEGIKLDDAQLDDILSAVRSSSIEFKLWKKYYELYLKLKSFPRGDNPMIARVLGSALKKSSVVCLTDKEENYILFSKQYIESSADLIKAHC